MAQTGGASATAEPSGFDFPSAPVNGGSKGSDGATGIPFIPVLDYLGVDSRGVPNRLSKREGAGGVGTPEIGASATPRPHHLKSVESSDGEGTRKDLDLGTSTPPTRRSVQFSRATPQVDGADYLSPAESENQDANSRDRRTPSIFAKLRALATSSGTTAHVRSQSGYTISGDSIDERYATFTPGSEAEEPQIAESPAEFETEDEADSEQSPIAEGNASRSFRRRTNSGRPQDGGTQTAPATPKGPSRPNFSSSQSSTINIGRLSRPSFLPRRATMPEVQDEDRLGVSEDEGRQRLAQNSSWRRVSGLRNMSYSGGRRTNLQSSGHTPRPSNFRRAITTLGGSGENTEPGSPFNMKARSKQWRARIQAGMRLIGRQPGMKDTIDQAKSAELLAELTAGVPAALIIASMFQRDDGGKRRIPVLLEQLKVKLVVCDPDEKSEERHPQYRLELEYGNGLTRMKWVVVRSARDFWSLHAKYKSTGAAKKYLNPRSRKEKTKFPKFPKSVFPYLRGIRGYENVDSEEDEEEEEAGTAAAGPSTINETTKERPAKKSRRSSMNMTRRRMSSITDAIPGMMANASDGSASGPAGNQTRLDLWPERQRKKLESYIHRMIRYFMFRAESNRLCRFLELSALGVRLAAEGSYHGKEGYLLIQSSKGVDFRKALTPSNIQNRHNFKWFLVRHSYIVCIESPEEMNIYDVFLIDSDFKSVPRRRLPIKGRKVKDVAKSAKESAAHPQHHKIKLVNSERKLRLIAKTERQMFQFQESIDLVIKTSPWAKRNRFDSFAPVRPKVFAQWLVDGRDYMWNVSRAISMAKDVIYIHDWWLSPELYMRRPAAISKKWRLDRLLQRKAQEGVKVFVIVYRNINSAIPIDSEYTKFSLLDLHPNVFVQRSPNQIRQGTFFWAHHEKICIVDHMIAFVGGIDLCFGRWDTPQHAVADDKLTGFEDAELPKDADHCQLWPGKDYSNPRVQDFYSLDKPYEEMYDRSKVPRMPWHDISMQIVGQPARDLTRHFVQRWNYILRQRKPSRPTPFLLPPPEFNPADLEALGLNGTCEVQILRSCCMWSMGTPDRVEHSIMNAYVKMIQQSEHFVYIENQFFISSCEWENVKIENNIGDALVERIIRAYQNDEAWRCVIVIPLMPGFQNTVDSQDGTSIRLIMQCQYRSICRGNSSIFARLRAENIEPTNYIEFYSLRSWGKIGPNQFLTTEQLYIHAKCMVVDDRVAIIGSANINERSMLGSRDSECAAVIRDTDMLWSTMDGDPYLVGRFPHTLRMRLMREHLGIDVDEIMEEERMAQMDEQWVHDMDEMSAEVPEHFHDEHPAEEKMRRQQERISRNEDLPSFNHDADWQQANNPNLISNKKLTADSRVTGNDAHRKDVQGDGADHMNDVSSDRTGRERNTTNATMLSNQSAGSTSKDSRVQSPPLSENSGNLGLPPPRLPRLSTYQLGLPLASQLPTLPKTDDSDIGGPSVHRVFSTKGSAANNPLVADMERPEVSKDCMRDPLNDDFYSGIWHKVAENNTAIFRAVFRCMPDNEVKNWKEYKEYVAYSERFERAQGVGKSKERAAQDAPGTSGPPGSGTPADRLRGLGPIGEAVGDVEKAAESLGQKLYEKTVHRGNSDENHPMGNVREWADDASRENAAQHAEGDEVYDEKHGLEQSNGDVLSPTIASPVYGGDGPVGRQHAFSNATSDGAASTTLGSTATGGSQKRKRRNTARSSKRDFMGSDDLISSEEGESMLKMVQGALVVWPYDWLMKEEEGGNWLYSIDGLAPLEIYN